MKSKIQAWNGLKSVLEGTLRRRTLFVNCTQLNKSLFSYPLTTTCPEMSKENETALAFLDQFWLRFIINPWPDGKIKLNGIFFWYTGVVGKQFDSVCLLRGFIHVGKGKPLNVVLMWWIDRLLFWSLRSVHSVLEKFIRMFLVLPVVNKHDELLEWLSGIM